jgi:glutamyl-tRNA synthetase
MAQNVRVRFAPSPTGPLHIGGVRTALFNYLFAKNKGGTFVLRIEDTDQKRFVEGAESYITESLDWLNIPFDEGPGKDGGFGPYRQSERKHLYKDYALQLVAEGKAYYAFDTAEALDAHRKDHEARGKTFIYNHHNREKLDNSLSQDMAQIEARIAAGEDYVIRFKHTPFVEIKLQDLIRGTVTVPSETLDDKVLYKSDGMPTYHLANIVDDHLMEISHVIRGEEWLPSLALHVKLYEAFGWDSPQFAHLPLIMKPVGKGKLSKRDGEKLGFPVFPLAWKESAGYREDGYFPEAVINFLALLGWNPGTEQELFSLDELCSQFDLARVNKSGARFDPEKNKWFNHNYLQQKPTAELVEAFKPIVKANGFESDTATLARIVDMIKERANFITDLWSLSDYFFQAPTTFAAKPAKKQWKEQTPTIMDQLQVHLEKAENFDSVPLEAYTKAWISENEYGFGQVMPPLRLLLVGDMKGPHIFDIMSVLGKQEVLNRLQYGITTLSENPS